MQLVVPAALHGERLDRGVALLTGMTRSQAARLVSEGGTRVGGRVVTSGSRRLSQGERLDLDEQGTEAASTPAITGPAPAGPLWAEGPLDEGQLDEGSALGATVVYVDEHVVVVDKPAGLVVHPGAGNPTGTLVDQLLARFPDISGAGPGPERPGIVHRLDKGTSGLLMVARTAAARQSLTAQLGARSVERAYLACAHGEIGADDGVVDAPLGRSQRDRVKIAVVEGGRHAVTRYHALCRSSAPLPCTLVTCRLETGRTHQIRVHMAAIGHPVVNDGRYAKPRLLAADHEVLPGLRRPWLHAAFLAFEHPSDGRRLAFSSPLPADLAQTLPVLGLAVPADIAARLARA